jgi:hypothetical protein
LAVVLIFAIFVMVVVGSWALEKAVGWYYHIVDAPALQRRLDKLLWEPVERNL